MKVNYTCPVHGVFSVDLPSAGGRGRGGLSPTTQPCPGPECGLDCHRASKPNFSITGATYARAQAYCKARKISLAKFIGEITQDL